MRTSLNEIKAIEEYLLQEQQPEDLLLFEAHMMLDEALKEKVQRQQRIYQLVRAYGRQQLRAEIEAAHQQLFTQARHRSFRQKVLRLFTK
ncbi:hypothetical protein OKW21_004895 [Catalinimonas alkaloidigena]|uniref:hypothetical protein n=1 Tax=Catalinimonas alkaloidigena TaxID=1075417 RepID=UPI00240695E0|nr:hypothetical protein [Catalinimonas alkaloidigena]MDF9799632.1 hypothetical protein [Catalinimonas alkaloidigena]